MAGMREVAKYAGVSLSTVSIVLSNGEKYVSPEIREKVLDAVEATGYQFPKRMKKKEKTIAVLLPVISSVFFSNVLNGIENVVREEDHMLVFGSSEFSFEKEKKYLDIIKDQYLAGVIIDSVCPLEKEEEYLEQLKRRFLNHGIPVVFLEQRVMSPEFGSVYVDHIDNAYRATKHLIQKGHKRIAYINGIADNPVSKQRMEGYKKAMTDSNLEYDKEAVAYGDFTPNSGYIAMKRILGNCPDLTAVFAANDQMAIGAMKAILSEGKKIPEEMAVCGIDDLSMASMVTPGLTTIHVPTYQMGREAAKMVIKWNRIEQRQEKLECTLIERRSTNRFAWSEWELFGW